MITINYNQYQAFNFYQLEEKDKHLFSNYHHYVSDQDVEYFYKKCKTEFILDNIKSIIAIKRLNNLNAIQNRIICQNGVDDSKIELKDYRNYYHLVFEYDVNKLDQIKNILKEKYNIQNVNLYQFDQKNLIYIFDKDSNFEAKINSPLFSNLNNRINNYNKENLIEQRVYLTYDMLFPFFNFYSTFCSSSLNIKQCCYFNNIFDQNWYNKFCQNMILFFDEITK